MEEAKKSKIKNFFLGILSFFKKAKEAGVGEKVKQVVSAVKDARK